MPSQLFLGSRWQLKETTYYRTKVSRSNRGNEKKEFQTQSEMLEQYAFFAWERGLRGRGYMLIYMLSMDICWYTCCLWIYVDIYVVYGYMLMYIYVDSLCCTEGTNTIW